MAFVLPRLNLLNRRAILHLDSDWVVFHSRFNRWKGRSVMPGRLKETMYAYFMRCSCFSVSFPVSFVPEGFVVLD